MALLPEFVVLKSMTNSKYLSYVEQPSEETYLQFCGDEVFGSTAKFEIQPEHDVPAAQGTSQPGRLRLGPSRHSPSQLGHANQAKFVHIRCCYNNRYLVGVDHDWIVADAEEPEKDTSESSCTLFEPIIADANTNTFQFRHVQLRRLLSIDMDTDTLSADPNKPTVECVVIDLDSLLRLPKRVVFRDDRGHYLRSYQINNQPCMRFAKKVNRGQGTMMEEVFVTGDGHVRIKSHGHGRFWRRDPTTNWILADSDGDPNDNGIDDALFWPVTINDNTIALRNKPNNWFCRRFISKFFNLKNGCLHVAADGFSKEAHLVVEEPFVSRRVRNVEFRLEHARINKITDMTVVTKKATNRSDTDDLAQELTLSYELEESYTWSSSIQSKLGFGATFTAGIPKLVDGRLEISGEVSNSFQWGKTVKKSVAIQSTQRVNVRPRTTAIARVTATKASYDVPFSYIQCDTLTSCDVVSDRIEDGVYSVVAWLDINSDYRYEPTDATT